MTRIAIIAASTRPNRRGRAVARWTVETARRVGPAEASFEFVDLADFGLPVLDEPVAGIVGDYRHEHTRRWAETIDGFDGFVLVTPEYNHGAPGGLKNAVDYLYAEWNNKAVGFVSYGVNGGVRAVEQLRQVAAEVKLADVRAQVVLSTYTDFDYAGVDLEDPTVTGAFAPDERHTADLELLLGEVVAWAQALAPLRSDIGVLATP